MKVTFDDDRLVRVLRVLHQEFVEFLQPIVRYGRVHVVRQMVFLAHREHRKVDRAPDEERPRIRQPTAVGVPVLHDLPQDHEERERRENRYQPQHEVVQPRWGRRMERDVRDGRKDAGHVAQTEHRHISQRHDGVQATLVERLSRKPPEYDADARPQAERHRNE